MPTLNITIGYLNMNKNIRNRIVEFFAFSYFNWLIVVPLLMPWVIFALDFTEEQFWVWLWQSFFVSLFIGWWTVKCDNRFAPWFYRKMGMKGKCECCGK